MITIIIMGYESKRCVEWGELSGRREKKRKKYCVDK
jgi:hypothetical protein